VHLIVLLMCLNFLLHMKLHLDHLFDIDLFDYTSFITHSFVCENTSEFLSGKDILIYKIHDSWVIMDLST